MKKNDVKKIIQFLWFVITVGEHKKPYTKSKTCTVFQVGAKAMPERKRTA